METLQDRLDDNDDSPVYNQAMDVINELKQRIAELEAEVERLEIENWYYEVLELVQYNWWLEIIEDVSEIGKEELIKIFKSAAKAAGRSKNG